MGKRIKVITKGRYELKFRGTECRNCGHVLDMGDKFCPNCGQANSTKKLVLKDFLDEFLSNAFNYDSKLLKTLSTMLIRPGTITKDYIRGKRVTYTNPFRFLFSLAFLYLLMVGYDSNLSKLDEVGFKEKFKRTGPMSFSFDDSENTKDSTQVEDSAKQALQQLDSLENLKGVPIPGIQNLDTLQSIITTEMDRIAKKDSMMLANPKAYFKELEKWNADNLMGKMEFFFTYLQKDSIKTFEEAQQKYEVDQSLYTRMAFNGSKSALRVITQPGSWLESTIAKLPFVVFFFLPVFAIFILLVYIRKNYTYTDHLIFSFHNQSLLFILLILSWIIDTIFNTATAWMAFTVFSVYLFQAMKKFYGQGVFKTIIKYLFLNSVFLFLALICVVLLFTGSVFTY
ncbi:MAG: DUF3667 domain-containing protein [Bacteroidota bacterium]